MGTHNELLVADGVWEASVEGDSEVIRVVPLVGDDVFKQRCAVTQNLSKTSANALMSVSRHNREGANGTH